MIEMAHTRKEAIQFLLNLIQSYPGRAADFYISEIIKAYGVRRQTASEYLRDLGEAGMIEVHGIRIYPKGQSLTEEEKTERLLLEYLESKAKMDDTGVSKDDTRISKPDTGVSYLLVYDMDSHIKGYDRLQIYRKLRKAEHDLLKQGILVERIQMSVWEVETKEAALKLVSCLPENKTKVRIYRVLEEEEEWRLGKC
jgi:DNA-binding transcriptional ArsR family regulator